MRTARAWTIAALCLLAVSGCLGQRQTAAEVISHARETSGQWRSCHCILDIEMSTDLIQDRLSVEVWEKKPAWLKVHVLSTENPQLRDLRFSTEILDDHLLDVAVCLVQIADREQ